MYLDSHFISWCMASFQIFPVPWIVGYPRWNLIFHPTLLEGTLWRLIRRGRHLFNWNHLKGLNERWDAKRWQVIQMSLLETRFSIKGHKSGTALAISLKEKEKSISFDTVELHDTEIKLVRDSSMSTPPQERAMPILTKETQNGGFEKRLTTKTVWLLGGWKGRTWVEWWIRPYNN